MPIPALAVPRFGGPGVALVVVTAGLLGAAMQGFLQPVALLITVGGALGVTRLTFSADRIRGAWQELREALGREADPEALIPVLKQLARIHRLEGGPALERAAESAPDDFVPKAVALVLECTDEEELRHALAGEIRARQAAGEAARGVLVTLGKLFPAFGLMGTLIGLVIMMRTLAALDPATMGSTLGLALLTTLYGIALANIVVLPLATKLGGYVARRLEVMQMIVEAMLLIHREELPTRVERVLRARIAAPLHPRLTAVLDRAA